jgi:hypothetical protein
VTLEDIRPAALREFARLTRHPATVLDAGFACTLDEGSLALAYGKRHAQTDLPEGALEWPIEQFTTEILKPLALSLLNSA